eukprot:11852-Heterococcus_DN1.PRE.2
MPPCTARAWSQLLVRCAFGVVILEGSAHRNACCSCYLRREPLRAAHVQIYCSHVALYKLRCCKSEGCAAAAYLKDDSVSLASAGSKGERVAIYIVDCAQAFIHNASCTAHSTIYNLLSPDSVSTIL